MGIDAPPPISLGALLHGHDRQPDAQVVTSALPTTEAVIIAAGHRMDKHGWVPATAGNLSLREDDGIAITRSGCHKGMLCADDIMRVDADGAPLTDARPSAETLLHCQIYRLLPHVAAVLHGHSIAATVLSMHRHGDIALSGYEVLKAFGQRSHLDTVIVPVFDNDQDIAHLASLIEPRLAGGMPAGYIIRGHGVYAWGNDMTIAIARLEALEFLLQCELEKDQLR